MSLRGKFEGVSCPRFGDDKQPGTNAVDKTKRVVAAGVKEIQAIHDEAVAELKAENKALKQQVASQALEIAELRQRSARQTIEKIHAMSDGTKTPRQAGQKPASSKGGRPRLPDDERDRRRRAQKAAARKPKP